MVSTGGRSSARTLRAFSSLCAASLLDWTSSITVQNNLWVSPNFRSGSNSSSGIYVSEDNLASFKEISGNVWATPKSSATWVNGGINYVGSAWGEKGAYKSADEWNKLPQVGTDFFTNDVSLKDVYQVKLHNTTVGSSLKMAA